MAASFRGRRGSDDQARRDVMQITWGMDNSGVREWVDSRSGCHSGKAWIAAGATASPPHKLPPVRLGTAHCKATTIRLNISRMDAVSCERA